MKRYTGEEEVFKYIFNYYWSRCRRKVWRRRLPYGEESRVYAVWRHTATIKPAPFGFYHESLSNAVYWPTPLIERKQWAAEYHNRNWVLKR